MSQDTCRLGKTLSCLMIPLLFLASAAFGQGIPKFDLAAGPLEVTGQAAPWRFVNAVGERAGIWGFENGTLEGWVYPMKLFHDFNLVFQVEGSPVLFPAEQLARAVRVRPQCVQLQYSAEQFTVTETLFTPRNEAGFVILLEAKSSAALRVFVRFRPDLSLMWPGALGGQTVVWNREKRWMELSEPSTKFSALIGSPAAVGSTAVGYHSYLSNEQPYEQIELRLAPEDSGREYFPIIVTGGIQNIYQPTVTYERILAQLPDLYAESLKHYAELDGRGPQFVTPDTAVNSALRWSRISLDQLRVCNPYLPCGYVSGYGSSGTGTRPMYAWFFDEPTVSSTAFLDTGSVDGVREAFRFLQKFQRGDGKIPHEISQSAGVVEWFKDYPYAYIHSDTSLWYLVAMGRFYRFTGDRAFLTESWPSLRKAYAYCVSILNAADGLLLIPPGEWGSMETAGVASEDSAMAGEWIAALKSLSTLASVMDDPGLAKECDKRAKVASDSLEKLFWNQSLNYYNYGVGNGSQAVTFLNPTIGYSAWYGSLPAPRARAVVERLATAQFLSDWGVRSMSLEDPRYSEASYQIGSAWPFMTDAAMIADFRYHNAVQGFLTWMSMAELRNFNARGAMPESLSGTYYRLLDNGVPHQMFSELVALPGLVDGILGVDVDAPGRTLHLTPHLPPIWPEIAVRKFPFGDGQIDIDLHQAEGTLVLKLGSTGTAPFGLDFAPGLPAGATVVSVKQQGESIPYTTEDNGSDGHVRIQVQAVDQTTIEVRYRGGLAVHVPWQPLFEGDSSRNLHVLETSYQKGHFQMVVEGRPELKYEVRLLTPWKISGNYEVTTGAEGSDWKSLWVAAPDAAKQHPDKAGFVRWTVNILLQPN
jgi:hypothetical protein